MTYLALQILVEVPPEMTTDQLRDKIETAAAGHNCALDPEEQCRLSWFATTSHSDRDIAFNWLSHD